MIEVALQRGKIVLTPKQVINRPKGGHKKRKRTPTRLKKVIAYPK